MDIATSKKTPTLGLHRIAKLLGNENKMNRSSGGGSSGSGPCKTFIKSTRPAVSQAQPSPAKFVICNEMSVAYRVSPQPTIPMFVLCSPRNGLCPECPVVSSNAFYTTICLSE